MCHVPYSGNGLTVDCTSLSSRYWFSKLFKPIFFAELFDPLFPTVEWDTLRLSLSFASRLVLVALLYINFGVIYVNTCGPWSRGTNVIAFFLTTLDNL